MRSGHRVDGSLHGTNLHIIPTYTYINKETRLAKFPALSRVIKFKYHRRGWSMRMRWEADVETRMEKTKKGKLANEKARATRCTPPLKNMRTIYVKKGVIFLITIRLNKFYAFQFCTMYGEYIYVLFDNSSSFLLVILKNRKHFFFHHLLIQAESSFFFSYIVVDWS